MDLKLNKLSKILVLEILNLDLKKVIDKKLKIKLNDLFVKNKVLSKKYDLIFVHILVPHKPYGFNEVCKYDVQRSNLNYYMNEKDEIKPVSYTHLTLPTSPKV